MLAWPTIWVPGLRFTIRVVHLIRQNTNRGGSWRTWGFLTKPRPLRSNATWRAGLVEPLQRSGFA